MRYFDYMATNPLRPEALEAMMPYLKEQFGNPLSLYDLGGKARQAVEDARAQVAALINAKPQEIIFTAGGAEANNFAIRGLALANRQKGAHLIVSRMEHHSVLNPARILEKEGFAVTYLNVDRSGAVDPAEVEKAITKETILISVLSASPEVGTIEPVDEIAAIAAKHQILFHTDAVASAAYLPSNVDKPGITALSLSAHEFGGPKGAGALYVKGGTRIMPLIYGGIQEGGRRAGTENVPAIAGMGAAASLVKAELAEGKEAARLSGLRDKLIKGILGGVENAYLTGHPERRLPGHASFCVEFIEGEAMLLMSAAKGIYAASGSACSSKALKASPVLLSMGISAQLAQGSIVFSMGGGTTDEDVDYVISEFPPVVKRLREISPYAGGWGEAKENPTCIQKN
ncbi:MAG: cysteine desulfurase family protein [Nitrospiraceae bacterium]|nr:cysteine desulfurase family protein [Nitrospiraceae bacterium]